MGKLVHISREKIDELARLSKLKFDESEKQALFEQLKKILAYFEQINELDLARVPPMASLVEQETALRKDESEPWLSQEKALQNAPGRHNGYFSVPKVIKN